MIDTVTILNKKDVHRTINNRFFGMALLPFHTIEKTDLDWGEEEEYEKEIPEFENFVMN